jgi:hypothetical protein
VEVAMDPKPETECTCAYRMLRGSEVRVVDPKCPEHGKRRHLKLVR